MYLNPRKESLKPYYRYDGPTLDRPPPAKSIHKIRSCARRRLLNCADAEIAEGIEALVEAAQIFNSSRDFARRNGMQLHADTLLDVLAELSRLDILIGRLREQLGIWERSVGVEIAPEIEQEIDAIRRKIARKVS